MAEFTMTIVKSLDFDKACSACQMAFGCLYMVENDVLEITAFLPGDMELIRDTLAETGSEFINSVVYF